MIISPAGYSTIFLMLWFCFQFFCLPPYYCICTQKLYIANFHYENLYRFNNILYFSGLFSASILIILAMDGFFWCKFWIRWHIFLFWVRVCRKSLDVYCGFFIISTQEIDLSQKDWWRKDGVLLLLFWLCCKFYIGHGFCFVYGYRIDLALKNQTPKHLTQNAVPLEVNLLKKRKIIANKQKSCQMTTQQRPSLYKKLKTSNKS